MSPLTRRKQRRMIPTWTQRNHLKALNRRRPERCNDTERKSHQAIEKTMCRKRNIGRRKGNRNHIGQRNWAEDTRG